MLTIMNRAPETQRITSKSGYDGNVERSFEMEPHLSVFDGLTAFGSGSEPRPGRHKLVMGKAIWAALIVVAAAVPAVAAPRGAPATSTFVEPHGADLNQGKSPAELFKTDCGVCHKSPQGLAKDSGLGLQSFLRQHYTTGTSNAAAMASYLASLGRGGAGAPAKPASPERQERAAPAATQPAPTTTARRPPAAEPANDGLTAPASEATRPPAEQAARPEPAEEAPKPAETATAPAAEAPGSRRRNAKPHEASKPDPKPARRATREESKPAEPEKPAAPAQTAEPAPAAVPPPEPKPAAPQIPL
jgi:hypothetical protein